MRKKSQAVFSTKQHDVPCDLKPYNLEPELKVMDSNPDDEEPLQSDEMGDCDTLTKVLLSLNLQM